MISYQKLFRRYGIILRKKRPLQSARRRNYSAQYRDDYIQHKERARQLVLQRIEHVNQVYNFSYNRIAIRNQRTRWGSCSSKKNLNFNYRLIYLPQELVDYIIVHELCHLQEMNHSPAFWRLVEKVAPNHRVHRKQLRKYQQELFR